MNKVVVFFILFWSLVNRLLKGREILFKKFFSFIMEFILYNFSIVINIMIVSYGGLLYMLFFFKLVFLVLYGIICVFGIFGNLMVIVVSCKF